MYVPGSRRYADPATYLYTPHQWLPKVSEFCRLVGKPAIAADALEQGKEELHAALAELEETLAGSSPEDTGTVRLNDEAHLVIPPLSAEDIPAEAKELKDELAGMLPFAPIASLLIELDARTNFLDCFTHAGGRKLTKSAETKGLQIINSLVCFAGGFLRWQRGGGGRPGWRVGVGRAGWCVRPGPGAGGSRGCAG